MCFKRAAMRITAGILTLSTLASPALALTGVTNTGTSKLNMRAKAASGSSILTKIPGGSSVEVLSTDTAGWYQISFSGLTGYVASQYVDLASQDAPSQDIANEESPAPQATLGKVNDGPLNVRSGPSTSHSKCGKLYAGQEVEILESLNGWYRIPQGYVSSGYITLMAAAPVSQDIPAQEAPSQDAPKEEAPAEPVPASAPASEKLYGRIMDGPLNVRSGPSTSHAKCGKLYAGKVVEILESTNSWYRVAEGYISADYVSIVDESALNPSSIAEQAVQLGLSLVGSPYVYGGSSPKGFDCSGFTAYIYRQFGINLSRSSVAQLDNGTPVAMSELMPGDLVLFKKPGTGSKRVSHVGLYIGDHKFVHASTYGVGVIVNDLSDAYYTTGFVGGRRVV